MGDNAQNFAIGDDSSPKGLVNNITENLNGVNLNDNLEQGPLPSNLEKPTESRVELTSPTEPTNLEMTSGMISSWMKSDSNEDNSASTVIVQNNTSSEKTHIVGELENSKEGNPNDYDIIEEDKNPKEVNKNEYGITEEEKNSKEVNLNEFDNPEKNKALKEPGKFIGRDICKELDGVKFFGTVTTYLTSLKLFEVLYKNGNRMEYLKYNEVLSHLTEKDKIYEAQLVNTSSNSSEKTIETVMEEAAFGDHVTSKRRMEDSLIMEGKSSRKRGKTLSGASSRKATNVEQTKVTPPPNQSAKTKKNKNSKSACKITKKEPETKDRPWHAKRENASKEEPYEPYQFTGLYVCKKINGIKSLATVIGYSPEKNKLIIQYKADDSIEYMTQLETLRSMAKRVDIMSSQSASGSEKKTDKKKNDDTEKASTSRTKKRTESDGPKI